MACFTLPVFIPGSGGQLPMSKSLMSKPLRPLIPDRLASAVEGKSIDETASNITDSGLTY